ncbi:MAG: VIT domain-containing protein [Fibrobacterota bacterium]
MRTVLSIICIWTGLLFAAGSLSVREDSQYGRVVPGYIEEAQLVVDISGGFAEQSLYITYSDRGEIGGESFSEIVHSFSLPPESVVGDMWLWIGDSIMQAEIMEQTAAQEDYDSITAQKIDPAILKVQGDQYDFNIYPLISGKSRKIKISFMTPLTYTGTTARVQLPLAFLNGDNSLQTPLTILYRHGDGEDSNPVFVQDTSISFSRETDTLDMTYRRADITDVQEFSRLELSCRPAFSEGVFADFYRSDSVVYYELGMYQKDFFNTAVDTGDSTTSVFCGVDLSGRYGVDSAFLRDTLSDLLNRVTTWRDSVGLVLLCDSVRDTLPLQAASADLSTVLDEFTANSRVLKYMKERELPTLLWGEYRNGGDDHCSTANWHFAEIDSLFAVDTAENLSEACRRLQDYDVVTSYYHGYNDYNQDIDLSAVEDYIRQGGTFIQFIDYNRTGDMVASRWLKGFELPADTDNAENTRCHADRSTEVGAGFPESFYHRRANPIRHTDTAAVNAVTDAAGRPVVVSKRIGRGMLILSGLWQFKDSPGLRTTLSQALLGAHRFNRGRGIDSLRRCMEGLQERFSWDQTLLLTNSIGPAGTDSADTLHGAGLPGVVWYNLLPRRGYTPPSVSGGDQGFFGAGAYLQKLAAEAGGMYQSPADIPLMDIPTVINPAFPPLSGLSLTEGRDGRSLRMTDITPNRNRPVFWYGRTVVQDEVDFTIEAEYSDSSLRKSITIPVTDSVHFSDSLIGRYYHQQELKALFEKPVLDTARILAIARAHRLLNDFTAFMAYEADSLHSFIKNPHDESDITTGNLITGEMLDQLQLTARLSGAGALNVRIQAPFSGTVTLRLFSLRGEQVARRSCTVRRGSTANLAMNGSFAAGMYIAVVTVEQGAATGRNLRRIHRLQLF